MIKQFSFGKALITVSFFAFAVNLLAGFGSHVGSGPQKELVRVALEGYNDLKQGNYEETHRLFKRTLDLASECKWPQYNYQKINKVLPKWVKQHKYDWEGASAQKILGLAQVYNSVKYYFAGFGITTNVNWDELVVKYIPKVIETRSLEEYYKSLQKLIASLNDTHTRIALPDTLQKQIYCPSVLIEFVENEFVITKVKDTDEIKKQNIYPGLRIKKVEAVSAKKFFTENKLPYMALSKVGRERLYRVYNLLSGKKNSKVKVTVADLSGKERNVMLTRDTKLYGRWEKLPEIEVKELEPGFVYFNFRAFWPSKTVIKQFEQEFNKLDLSKTKGMILDVRENTGGNSRVGGVIISHLINKPFKAWLFKSRVKSLAKIAPRAWMRLAAKIVALFGKEWYETYDKIKPSSGKRYSGPVVVLTSRYTASAAEDFVVAVKESGRAKIIGETTSGGTGNGLFSILPGYGTLRVCVNIGYFTNGKPWQGTGIDPNINVSRKIKDIYNGYDRVLAKGLEILKELNN